MPTLDAVFPQLSKPLVDPSGRFPSDFDGLDPFEAIVAVFVARHLGQMKWKAMLDGLREADLLSPTRLANADLIEIADAMRGDKHAPSVKTLAPLKQLARWFVEHDDPGALSVGRIREELAELKGIGVAGADAILLFALKQPSYPVDRASFRILVRHGWLDPTSTYEEARDALTDAAASAADRRHQDAASLLVDLAPRMEQLGRTYCRVAAPRCDGCPLESLLPEGGPRDVND